MFDVNKLSEWKSALDDGFRFVKELDDETDVVIEKLTNLEYSFKIIKLYPEKCKFIYEKDFDVFCQKVSEAILNNQE